MQMKIRCKWYETSAEIVLMISGLISAIAVAAIFVFLIYFTIPVVLNGDMSQLVSWTWRPAARQYGILPMAVGSLCLATSATLAAYPLGIGICCFVHGLGPRRLSRMVMIVIDFMTGVPTVVYGFLSVFMLVPLMRRCFESGTGFSWAAASITLTILILPTIVLVIHTQLRQSAPEMELAGTALGISRAQILLWIIFPHAFRGLSAAAVLGFGRALGDTIVSLMLAGNAAQVPHSLLDSIRTLPAHIALVTATDVHSTAYHSLFVSGLVLATIAALVNITIRWITGKSHAGRSNA